MQTKMMMMRGFRRGLMCSVLAGALAAPAAAQVAAPQPTASDARKLTLVEDGAQRLASGRVPTDDVYAAVDAIDQAWNAVEPVYAPLDTRANFSGGQAAPYTVMGERISILNSAINYGDDAGTAESARDVADWARRLLEITGAPH